MRAMSVTRQLLVRNLPHIRLVDVETRGKRLSKFTEGRNDAIDVLALKWPLESAESKVFHFIVISLAFQVVFQLRFQVLELR